MVFTGVFGGVASDLAECENRGGTCVLETKGCIDNYGQNTKQINDAVCPESQICCNKAILGKEREKLGEGKECVDSNSCADDLICDCDGGIGVVTTPGPNLGKCKTNQDTYFSKTCIKKP